jgi:mannosyl-oligosaccharide alpha-1,2-mannosidase
MLGGSDYSKESKPLSHRIRNLRHRLLVGKGMGGKVCVVLCVLGVVLLIGLLFSVLLISSSDSITQRIAQHVSTARAVHNPLPNQQHRQAEAIKRVELEREVHDLHKLVQDLKHALDKLKQDNQLLEQQKLDAIRAQEKARKEELLLRAQALASSTQQQDPPRETEDPHKKKPLVFTQTDFDRREEVRREFVHAWSAYKKYAWGMDDLHPLSRKGSNGYGLGLTLIDALDTIIIMDLDKDYEECKKWIKNLDVKNSLSVDVNVFEVTIRVIGGLMSGYYLKKEKLFLEKALMIADALIVAFDTTTGIPKSSVNLVTGHASNPSWLGSSTSLSEAGTIQLEWQTLSRASGNTKYAEKADRASEALYKVHRPKGLYTRFVDTELGHLSDGVITLGARVDSVYEYFLKQYIMAPERNARALEEYIKSVDAIRTHLYSTDQHNFLKYIQEMQQNTADDKMDHLVCFLPGTLALGSRYVGEEKSAEHMSMAKELIKTCVEMYKRSPTGLSPEIVRFSRGLHFDRGALHNLLRPETLESLFVLYRVTGDVQYKEWGYEIFSSLKRYCRLPEGYDSLNNVEDVSTEHGDVSSKNWRDHMESFFLAETLKYAFLLFSEEDLISLESWVLNTEGHPLPIIK